MRLRAIATIPMAACLLFPLAACGGGENQGGSAAPVAIGNEAEEDDLLCSLQLNPEQTAELQQYVNQAPDGTTPDVESVCVLDEQGVVNYYDQDDNFAEYWLYAMLFRRSANLLLLSGLASGELDAGEYLTLSLLVGIDDDDHRPYHLYRQSGGQWLRQENDAALVQRPAVATHVKYGSTTAQPIAGASTPAGYRRFNVPAAQDASTGTHRPSTSAPRPPSAPSTPAVPTTRPSTPSTPTVTPSRPSTASQSTASSSRSSSSSRPPSRPGGSTRPRR